jgi:hypothetical protein
VAQTTNAFPQPQPFERTHGPAPGAASDGLTPGSAYAAVIRSAISAGGPLEGPEGFVRVTIPGLHLSETWEAHIQPETPCEDGQTCLVIFDDSKVPWVVTGTWKYA